MKNRKLTFTAWFFAVGALLAMVSCSEDRTTSSYRTHPPDWDYPEGEEFHGQQAILSAGQSCATCHGSDFSGGQSGVGCFTCHEDYPHPSISNGAGQAHATVIAESNWNLSNCIGCHGDNFAGGRTHASCLGCHNSPGGPAACNTCHGNPPANDQEVLSGMASGSFGAHAVHVSEKGYACTECHLAVTDLSHIGALPADVSFANSEIAARPPYPTGFTHQGNELSGNGTCATYCHSDARGGAPLVNVEWVGGRLTVCQSCHTVPPPAPGHTTIPQCHLCHFNVDPTSNYTTPEGIRFIDPSLHVNGVVDISIQP